MKREYVLEAFAAIRDELFEDVFYTPVAGAPVLLERSISGIEPNSERFELFGEKIRTVTHLTRAALASFPNLKKGDLLDDGRAFRVIDFEPVGDGRVEIVIALAKV